MDALKQINAQVYSLGGAPLNLWVQKEYKTEAGMNSAIHAIFGMETKKEGYVHSNPNAFRRKMANALETSKPGDAIDKLGKCILTRTVVDREHSVNQEWTLGNVWPFIKEIESLVRDKFSKGSNERKKFFALAQDDFDERNKIRTSQYSSPQKFLAYTALLKQIVGFVDWNARNKKKRWQKLCENLKKTHSNGGHRLDHFDVELLAKVGKCTVHLYGLDKHEKRPYLIGDYNKGQKNVVHISYVDGQFRRLEVSTVNPNRASQAQVQQQLQANAAKVDELAQKVTELSGKVTDQEGELASVKQESATLKTKVTELNGKVAEQAEDLEAVKTELRNQASDSGSEASVEDPAFAEKMGLGGEI